MNKQVPGVEHLQKIRAGLTAAQRLPRGGASVLLARLRAGTLCAGAGS